MNYLKERKNIFKVIREVREKAPVRTPFLKAFYKDRCAACGKPMAEEEHAIGVCASCGNHVRIAVKVRINMLFDEAQEVSFAQEQWDPLDFPGYEKKRAAAVEVSGCDEAAMVWRAVLADRPVMVFGMDANFLMGSMGHVAGSRIAYAFDAAVREGLPVIGFCASGGARMQEGVFSLMQMANTTFAVRAHHEAGLFYTAVLTDPTTGGVSASFASLADVTLAEPGARICFTGKRVIKETIKEELPEGFQTAESLLSHGFLDAIVPRTRQKDYLTRLLSYHR